MYKPNEFLTTTQFAKAIGVHPDTIRRWDKQGLLKPNHIMPGSKTRLYTQQQVNQYLQKDTKKETL